MLPTKNNLKVIKKISGPNTGDEYIKTEDGAIWKVVGYLPTRGTGDKQGILNNDNVTDV